MTHTPAANLAIYAKLCLEGEGQTRLEPDDARRITRVSMADVAEDLGFAADEIEAAIDAAIAAASAEVTR